MRLVYLSFIAIFFFLFYVAPSLSSNHTRELCYSGSSMYQEDVIDCNDQGSFIQIKINFISFLFFLFYFFHFSYELEIWLYFYSMMNYYLNIKLFHFLYSCKDKTYNGTWYCAKMEVIVFPIYITILSSNVI
jgi:hypothetical protein